MNAIYLNNGEIQMRETPMPELQSKTDVLVRISYASICGYDIMTMNGEATQSPSGGIGHEASGIVMKIGAGVRTPNIRPGARVAIEAYRHCTFCEECRAGRPEYCVNPGGNDNLMREYVVADESQLFVLPDAVSLKEGCLTEPVMMGMYALSKGKFSAGSSLLILGGGSMGQIMLKLAKLQPLAQIIVADPVASKRQMALAHGATAVIDPAHENLLEQMNALTEGRGFDTVIEASGSRRSATIAPQLIARGGALVFFGLYGMDFNLPLNLFQLYWKDASVHAVCVPGQRFPSVIKLLPTLDVESVITGLYPYTKAQEAFTEKAAGEHCKVMLEFAGENTDVL